MTKRMTKINTGGVIKFREPFPVEPRHEQNKKNLFGCKIGNDLADAPASRTRQNDFTAPRSD